MKYLVYNIEKDTDVDFVLNDKGETRVFDTLDEAEQCASEETNGYVVPLGWDPIDALTRLQALDGRTSTLYASEDPTEESVNKLIEEGTELAKEFCDVLQQPYEAPGT